MTPKLYSADISPAVRAVLLVAKGLKVDLEKVPIDLFVAKDQMKPEFLEMNPFHTIPTLKDGDFVVWDSAAINIYLAEKYGKGDSLYPADVQVRAVINQRLFFNSGVLFARMGAIIAAVLSGTAKRVSKEHTDAVFEGYALLETLLERSAYVAGETLSLADLTLIATVSTSNILVPIASNHFPKISAWMEKMQALPYYKEANQQGLDTFATVMRSKLS